MIRSPILRVSLGIALITLTLVLVGDTLFGVSTEGARPRLDARKHLIETLAVHYSDLAARGDFAAMGGAMRLVVERNPEILSTAVRRNNGTVLAHAGDHRLHWRGALPVESSETHARVPIFDGNSRWGTLEVRFTPVSAGAFGDLVDTAWFRMLAYLALAGSLSYFIYMRRTLRHLDPSAVVPARVKAAFDALAEGVVFIDERAHIVLANTAFARAVGVERDALMGRSLDGLGWRSSSRSSQSNGRSPWDICLSSGERHTGEAVVIYVQPGERRDFTANAAPIQDDRKRTRGAIVTFDDVTELEQKKVELERAIEELQGSRDQIQRQNEKLEIMATRDGLTNCLNRRAFVDALSREVELSRRDALPLTCIMFDIDHFKRVNDSFGHGVGDDAICFVAGVANEVTRGFDIVCRYGGEEFCVLLPGTGLAHGVEVAERIRRVVRDTSAESLPQMEGRGLTISLGIATLVDDMARPMDLVDHADTALYHSKSSGRDRSTIAGEDSVLTAEDSA